MKYHNDNYVTKYQHQVRIKSLSYDPSIFANLAEELYSILLLYGDTFTSSGMQPVYDKSKTIAFNADEELILCDSLVTLGEKKV